MTKNELKQWIAAMPKVELHLHIEGSLEPDLMMSLAEKHQVILPYANIEEVKAAYNFDDLQSFLDLYYSFRAFDLYFDRCILRLGYIHIDRKLL